MVDGNIFDSNVVDTNTITQTAQNTIQNLGSQQNIDLLTNIFNNFVAFVMKMFSDAFLLLQTNALVYGIALLVFIYLLKNFVFDRFDSSDRIPSLLKWFFSFLIVMAVSPFWSPLIAGFVK